MLLLFSICLSKSSNIQNCKCKQLYSFFQYYYSAILLLWRHCRLFYLFFNLFYFFSLLYQASQLSLFPHFVSLSLSQLLSTLTLSLCAGGWASTLICGLWVSGSIDRQVWSSGLCGFFFWLWPVLKGRGV